MLRVGVSGVAGKMGREIVAAMRDYKETKLTAALESPDSPHLGEELSGVPISASFVAGAADVFIDFSVPAAATNLAAQCCAAKTPLVIGATGFAENEKAALAAAAADIALVVSPNMSVGVNVMFLLAEFAARRLRDCDAEISESHHRGKKDAPSGTALRLGEAVAAATWESISPTMRYFPDTGATISAAAGKSDFRSYAAATLSANIVFCLRAKANNWKLFTVLRDAQTMRTARLPPPDSPPPPRPVYTTCAMCWRLAILPDILRAPRLPRLPRLRVRPAIKCGR